MSNKNHTIKIKDYSKVFEEYVAVAAITPGHLLEYTSAGKVQKHSAAGQNNLPMIAVEDELQGNGINDAYSANDPVQVWIPRRGDQAWMILADGENAAIGSLLESAGDGTVRVHDPDVVAHGDSSAAVSSTVYTNVIVGEALEAVNTSASSGAESSAAQGTQRIKVRIY